MACCPALMVVLRDSVEFVCRAFAVRGTRGVVVGGAFGLTGCVFLGASKNVSRRFVVSDFKGRSRRLAASILFLAMMSTFGAVAFGRWEFVCPAVIFGLFGFVEI